MPAMGIDEILRQRIAMLLEEKDISVNALADKAEMREGAVRAIMNGKTQSTRLATVERIASAFGVTPGHLLGVESAPINEGLLSELLKRILRSVMQRERLVDSIAQSVLQAYVAGMRSGVDPHDQRDMDILTSLEVDRLRRASLQSKASQ